jgi:DNA-binding NarL/FixJ family response regulator
MAPEVRTILVVEDDPLVASCVCDILGELEFAVLGAASSGPEALSLAEQDRPDLAVVDIRLSGPLDGVDIARVLTRRFGTAVIFLSGASDQTLFSRAQNVRPVKFLHKPFRPSQLLEAIDAARVKPATPPEAERRAIPTQEIEPSRL